MLVRPPPAKLALRLSIEFERLVEISEYPKIIREAVDLGSPGSRDQRQQSRLARLMRLLLIGLVLLVAGPSPSVSSRWWLDDRRHHHPGTHSRLAGSVR